MGRFLLQVLKPRCYQLFFFFLFDNLKKKDVGGLSYHKRLVTWIHKMKVPAN